VLRLVDASERMPSDSIDGEVLAALWPLLGSGSPRTLLLGKLVVALGLDSATANRRLREVLAELANQGLIFDNAGVSGLLLRPPHRFGH
jgi:hypothetical protein